MSDTKRPKFPSTRDDPEIEAMEVPPPKLNWMNQSREWHTRVRPGKKGLTLGSLNVGIYGEVPTHWDDQNRNPRGAIPAKGRLPVGYTVSDKSEMWAPCAADLYEEAIQRRWAPATDVPWHTIKPLPEELERAICQVCTELTQYANIDIEVISDWQHRMAYGYHEVKQFLATTTLDAARRYEAFRKRALSNGGGLGLEPTCQMSRALLESRGGWTETVVALTLVRGLFTIVLLRFLAKYAYNQAELTLYEHVNQDLARLVTYGLEHLKYCIQHTEDQKSSIGTMIAISVGMFSRDLRDPVLREALAIVFGGSVAQARTVGMEVVFDFLEAFRDEHIAACRYLDIDNSVERMPRAFRPREQVETG